MGLMPVGLSRAIDGFVPIGVAGVLFGGFRVFSGGDGYSMT
jgi:hypothetical protein